MTPARLLKKEMERKRSRVSPGREGGIVEHSRQTIHPITVNLSIQQKHRNVDAQMPRRVHRPRGDQGRFTAEKAVKWRHPGPGLNVEGEPCGLRQCLVA